MSRWSSLLAGGIIILAVLAAYRNSLSGPFIFDDPVGITDNATIRHLWPVWQALTPPHGMPDDGARPVAGRPIANFSLAVNYAFGGLAVRGYHVLNLLVHTLAALTLFGIVRRTLECGRGALTQRATQIRGEGTPPTILALAVALLWALHPLQTEAVTYISQRAESLMGLFYLYTLYCFIRGVENGRSGFKPDIRLRQGYGGQASGINPDLQSERGEQCGSQRSTPCPPKPWRRRISSRLWYSASILACFLGMASKEVMVSAPLMVLLYDRTFVAGTFREAWARRRPFYISLAATWILLGYLVASTHGRGGSAGFGVNITWWPYALTQFRAIVHYLQLSLWPNPLVFDYGTPLAARAMEIMPYAVVVVLLVIGTTVALWRWPAVGFFGCWFFAILAPTSSVVPVATQTMAEHRMYLALAAVVVLVVLGLHALLGRCSAVVFLALAVGLGCVTERRNGAYHDELTLWSDTVANCPGNERAHDNLGNTLVKMPNRIPDAIAEYEAAIRITPDIAKLHINLGNAWLKLPGHSSDERAEFETAVRLEPRSAEAHNDLGSVLLDVPGRLPDAVTEFEAALRIDPVSVEAHDNLGTALFKMPGRLPDAIAQFEAALRIDPDSMEAHSNLGSALLAMPGRLSGAIAQYEAALRINPDSAGTHYNLGCALLNEPGRLPDAMDQLQAALRLQPDFTPARELLDQLQNPHGLDGAVPVDSSLHSNDKP
jgi:protein O-mannosyl-transferase